MDAGRLGGSTVLRGTDVDATVTRERARRRRLRRLAVVLAVLATWLWFRSLSGNPVGFGWPRSPPGGGQVLLSVGLTLLLALVVAGPLVAAGRSPHTVLRPADTGVGLHDVVGADATTREAVDTLNLFLAHRTFTTELGGTARRGVLFEGPPGTGKTHLAKAMAGEAGVPFLFVSASAFQSMYYGQTNRKLRSFFRALRKAARAEGGAIGFIEEFDAIGAARSGMEGAGGREGITGVVNELLVQMQSFELPSGRDGGRGPAGRPGQSVAPRPSPAAPPGGPAGQRAGRGGHQPGRRPRPGAAPARALRPPHPLRPPGSGRPSGHRRLLPRAQGPRARCHRRRGGRHHQRLRTGPHRAPAGRGAGLRPAARAAGAELGRRAGGQDGHRARGLPARRWPIRRSVTGWRPTRPAMRWSPS